MSDLQTKALDALQGLMDVMLELDTRELLPPCQEFMDKDDTCRVCTALERAQEVLLKGRER